jgi:hypothetical protein
MLKHILAACAFALAVTAASAGAIEEKDRQAKEVAAWVAAGNYTAIQDRADRLLASKSRYADGIWRLSFLYSDFCDALKAKLHGKAAWERAARRTAVLAQRRPHAWLLHEQVLYARAWAERGPGYAYEVKSPSWPVFRQLLEKSRETLDAHKAVLADHPSWYSIRLSLSTELGEDQGLARAIFEEGASRHGDYHALYFARLRNLSPAWHGSKQQMLDFLGQVAGMPGPATAEALYARLLWIADELGTDLIREPAVSAEAWHASADRLATTYPDQWNVQQLFFMACQRSDKPHAQKMLALVRPPALAELFESNLPLFDACRDWAVGKLPAFIMRDHAPGGTQEYLIR